MSRKKMLLHNNLDLFNSYENHWKNHFHLFYRFEIVLKKYVMTKGCVFDEGHPMPSEIRKAFQTSTYINVIRNGEDKKHVIR